MSHDIQKKLSLKAGAQFVVIGEKDVVILKTTTPPPMEEFDTLIADTRLKGAKIRIPYPAVYGGKGPEG